MQIEEFVKDKFGQQNLKLLRNMRKGGANNQKGSNYEMHFTIAKVFEIAANQSTPDDFLISRQEYGFVDDIVIRQESCKTKHNYQAKDSKGTSSKWSNTIENKFRMQHEIDIAVHGYPNSHQILLVSTQDQAIKNSESIPMDMKTYSTSEYHPSAKGLIDLLKSDSKLRYHASKVCNSNNLSDLDSALRIVLSVCHDACPGTSVGDIIGRARDTSKPDLFSGAIAPRSGPPGWLLEKCAQFPGMRADLQRGNYVVTYSGFEVSLEADVNSANQEILEELDNPMDFMHHLMQTLTIHLV